MRVQSGRKQDVGTRRKRLREAHVTGLIYDFVHCAALRPLSQTASTVASALSAVEGIGSVNVQKESSVPAYGEVSWTYTIDFLSLVGDVEELKVGSGEPPDR